DMGLIAQFADIVGVMYAGKLVEIGPVRQMIETPRHPYTKLLVESLPGIEGGAAHAGLVRHDGVDHLLVELHDRVERAHRALRDERDVAQPRLAQLARAHLEDILTVEQHLAAGDAAGSAGQAHQRRRHGGLARAGLADEAEPFAGLQGERHVVHRLGRTLAGVVVDVEALDDENGLVGIGHGHQRLASLGLAKRSKPTEVRKRPMKISAMTTMGGPHHHQ
ncbi:MAG: hypothetical protein J0J13_14690, partial [Devosia sp.]|nr:hypothetical protein [Devosia sp.]